MPTSSSLNAAVRQRRYEVYEYSDVTTDQITFSGIRVVGEKTQLKPANNVKFVQKQSFIVKNPT